MSSLKHFCQQITLYILTLQSVTILVSSADLDYVIDEEEPSGMFVANIATDSGIQTGQPEQRYSFLTSPGERMDYFNLNSVSGILTTAVRIDRDRICPRYDLDQKCSVEFDVAVSPPQPRVLSVIVEIRDLNDNRPLFYQNKAEINISEGAEDKSTYNLPIASDPDSVPNGLAGYELIGGNGYFDLSVKDFSGAPGTVQLELIRSLDREDIAFHNMTLIARDGGSPPKTGSVHIIVHVQDINDNKPVFEENTDLYTASVLENTDIGGSIITIRAEDQDISENARIKYRFSAPNPNQYSNDPRDMFNINPDTGVITVAAHLDYEDETSYEVQVEAYDVGPTPLTSYVSVNIRVMDVNDNPPEISIITLTESGMAEVEENSPPNTFVAYISVKDKDQEGLEQFSCSLNDASNFYLEFLRKGRYEIKTRLELDSEEKNRYNVTLTCEDSGSLSSTIDILIKVMDVNDHAPVFKPRMYNATIAENNNIGDFILQVTAQDPDEGKNAELSYQLSADVASFFTLDSQSGIINANTVFDYENLQDISFVVYAVDRGELPRTSTAVVEVIIQDINDEAPVFLQQSYTFRVREEQMPGEEVGQVSATDEDSYRFSSILYSIDTASSASAMFAIDSSTGIIETIQLLRREERPVYYLTVIASNPENVSPVLSGTATVTISILDMNNNSPVITFPTSTNYTVRVSSDIPVGERITTVEAYDLDVGINALLRYSLESQSNDGVEFRIDPRTGEVSSVTSLKHIEGQVEYKFDVKVSDGLHETRQDLLLTVDSSIPYHGASSSDRKSLLTGSNLTIVVAMAVSCGIIVIILVIAIILIRHKDKQRRIRKHHNSLAVSADGELFHCQIEPSKPNSYCNKTALEYDEKSKIPIRKSSGSFGASSSKQTVSFRSKEHPSKSGNSWPTRSHEKQNGIHLDNPTVQPLSAKHLQQKCDREGIPHRSPEGDSDSAYSGDVSNTDSGRGPSEEGELGAQQSAKSPGSNSFFDMRIPTPAKPGNSRLQKSVGGPLSEMYPPQTHPEKKPSNKAHPYYNQTLLPPPSYQAKQHPAPNHPLPSTSTSLNNIRRNVSFNNNGTDNQRIPPPRPARRPYSPAVPNTPMVPTVPQLPLNRNSTGSNGSSSSSGSYIVDNEAIYLGDVPKSGFKSIVV